MRGGVDVELDVEDGGDDCGIEDEFGVDLYVVGDLFVY